MDRWWWIGRSATACSRSEPHFTLISLVHFEQEKWYDCDEAEVDSFVWNLEWRVVCIYSTYLWPRCCYKARQWHVSRLRSTLVAELLISGFGICFGIARCPLKYSSEYLNSSSFPITMTGNPEKKMETIKCAIAWACKNCNSRKVRCSSKYWDLLQFIQSETKLAPAQKLDRLMRSVPTVW